MQSDIVVDIDEGSVVEGTNNESIRHEATPSPVNNSNHPFAAVNEILEQNPEVYSILRSFLRYLPFAILILLKEIYEHTTGSNSSTINSSQHFPNISFLSILDLFVILGLFATFTHANNTVKHQVSRQAKRELGSLAIIALNITTCIFFVYFLNGNNELKHR